MKVELTDVMEIILTEGVAHGKSHAVDDILRRIKNLAYGKIYTRIDLSVDGDKFTAKYDDFINLQESPCGFGDTQKEAVQDLLKQGNKSPISNDKIFDKEGNLIAQAKGGL
jgi:hypothetical protein